MSRVEIIKSYYIGIQKTKYNSIEPFCDINNNIFRSAIAITSAGVASEKESLRESSRDPLSLIPLPSGKFSLFRCLRPQPVWVKKIKIKNKKHIKNM